MCFDKSNSKFFEKKNKNFVFYEENKGFQFQVITSIKCNIRYFLFKYKFYR